MPAGDGAGAWAAPPTEAGRVMAQPTIPEAEFVKLFKQLGAHGLARKLKINVRSVYFRRQGIERRLGEILKPPLETQIYAAERHGLKKEYPHRAELNIQAGHVIIGSDFHYWPGEPSTCHRAFVQFIKKLKPQAVIANGDVMDAASISLFHQQ
jgi:hypothetical protein